MSLSIVGPSSARLDPSADIPISPVRVLEQQECKNAANV